MENKEKVIKDVGKLLHKISNETSNIELNEKYSLFIKWVNQLEIDESYKELFKSLSKSIFEEQNKKINCKIKMINPKNQRVIGCFNKEDFLLPTSKYNLGRVLEACEHRFKGYSNIYKNMKFEYVW